jgi:hypothetical protein
LRTEAQFFPAPAASANAAVPHERTIMGTYTEHWKNYMRDTRRHTLRVMGWLVVGLPGTALVAYLVGRATGEYPVVLHLALLVAWLVVLTVLALRSTAVVCPRCATVYKHSKWQLRCPSCALAILQEEP